MEPLKEITVEIRQEDWDRAMQLRRDAKDGKNPDYRISCECPLALATLRALNMEHFPHPHDGCAANVSTIWNTDYHVDDNLSLVVRKFDVYARTLAPLVLPITGTLTHRPEDEQSSR